MMTRVQTTEFPQDIYNSQSLSQRLRHMHPFWSCPLSQRCFWLRATFRHSKTFTTLKSSPPMGLLNPETLLVLKASALSLKLQQ